MVYNLTMSKKIILVIENAREQDFLDKLLRRLGFNVLVAGKAEGMTHELSNFVPDLVFASILGKKSYTLKALAKVRDARGIPKVVLVRGGQDQVPLTNDQKQIVDGLLKSPIDPFEMLTVLADQLSLPLDELKNRYHQALKGSARKSEASGFGSLIKFQQSKSEGYQTIVDKMSSENFEISFNTEKLKKIGKEQSAKASNDKDLVDLKKEFLKKLFDR